MTEQTPPRTFWDTMHESQHAQASPEGQRAQSCVLANRYGHPEDVLERCGIDPGAPYALALIYFLLAHPTTPSGRVPGWVNSHCTPMVIGYRCDWKGLWFTS